MQLPFFKMNGAGNDFVMLDGRVTPYALNAKQIRNIASRDNAQTRGCDQVIVLEPASEADVYMRIYNADGSEVDACGNATRCVASLLEQETNTLPVVIRTNAGLLKGVKKLADGDHTHILVDMGKPNWDWQQLPLAMPTQQATQEIEAISPLKNPIFVNMGNPHVVFFVAPELGNAAGYDATLFPTPFDAFGKALEYTTQVFPQRINVSVAQLQAQGNEMVMYARVWERGAGLTQACGTAACAMLAAANQRDAGIRQATVRFMPHGTQVNVSLSDNGHVLLGGHVETEFTGMLDA